MTPIANRWSGRVGVVTKGVLEFKVRFRDVSEMTVEQQFEANVYGFLARLWLAEVDEELAHQLQSQGVRDAFVPLGGYVPPAGEPMDIEKLAREYCACFLGPQGHLPPFQSVVQQSHFQGDCLSSINKFVKVIGLPQGKYFEAETMRDHAGILLGMMQRVQDSLADASDGAQCELSEVKEVFFERHLEWLIHYCEVALTRTTSRFYRGLFEVTRSFLVEQRKAR